MYSPPPSTVGSLRAPRPVRRTRLSAALTGAALIVTLGAGASVFTLLNGTDDTPPPLPGPTPASDRPVSPPGAVPSGYLGTWTASIDNSRGHNTRSLTITQGEVGDTVLNLVATGPTDTGAYQCAFVATLAEQPSNAALLRIGPSRVTSGEPASYCTPGAATTLTLLPNGTLQRVTAGSGERLTYEKES